MDSSDYFIRLFVDGYGFHHHDFMFLIYNKNYPTTILTTKLIRNLYDLASETIF